MADNKKSNLTPEVINRYYPIKKLKIYPNGVAEVKRSNLTNDSTAGGGVGTRKAITKMTNKSRTRLAYTMYATSVEFRSIITLTYPSLWPNNGTQCKAHLNSFLTWFRGKFPHQDYAWIVEFQDRGAPHYHIMTTVRDPDGEQRHAMAWAWKSIVGRWYWGAEIRQTGGKVTPGMLQKLYRVHCHRDSWEQIRKPDGARRYMAKYALKPAQKLVPYAYQNIGRFWGVSRGVTDAIESTGDWVVCESDLRRALKALYHQVSDWDVLPKVIFDFHFQDVSRET